MLLEVVRSSSLLSTPVRRINHLHVIPFPQIRCPKRRFSTDRLGKVMIITGPTGVGKTQLAFNLARSLNGEIISADSIAVYKGMDIGTAKPPEGYMQEVPHHLIDVLSPSEPFNASIFSKLGRQALHDIESRGKVPIIVGGSHFYLKCFINGLPPSPPGDKKVEMELESELRPKGWDYCYSYLSDIDPVSAKRINRNDWYRLFRSLAVYKTTGKLYSSFLDHKPDPLERDFRNFFLTRTRSELYANSDLRCEEMIASGLLNEVSQLLKENVLSPGSPSAKAIGYSEGIEFLLNSDFSSSAFLQFLYQFQASTRQLIHDQCMWFRRNKEFLWMNEASHSKVLSAWEAPREDWEELLKGESQHEMRHLSQTEQKELKQRVPIREIFRTDAQVGKFLKSNRFE